MHPSFSHCEFHFCLLLMLCSYCSLTEAHSGATRSTLPLLPETEKGPRVKCPEWPLRWSSHVALVVKTLSANSGDIRHVGLIPRLGRSPGGGHDDPLQYSCLENPWTEEPGGLQPIGLQRGRHDWSALTRGHAHHLNNGGWSLKAQKACLQQGQALSYSLYSRAPPWDESEPILSPKLFPCLASPSILSCLPHFLTISPGIPS